MAGPEYLESELFEAMLAVAQNLELPEVLNGIVSAAAGLIGARYAALGVLSEETHPERGGGAPGCPHSGSSGASTKLLAEFHHHGMTGAQVEAIGDYPRGGGVLGTLIDEPRPLRLPDLSAHPDSVGFPANHPPMRSFLGVPVVIRGAVYGNLYLTEKIEGEEFDDDDERLLIALAAIAAAAINNARLFDASQRHRRWLSAGTEAIGLLNRQALPTGREADEGGDQIGEQLAHLLLEVAHARIVAVALPPADGEELPAPLSFTAVAGEQASAMLGEMDHNLALVINSSAAQNSSAAVRFDEYTVVVALRVGSRLLGALWLAREGQTWQESELELIASFADQVSLALENLRNERNRHRLAVYSDRDRIARDLHDQVIQRIFAVGLGLQGLARRTTDGEISDRLGQHIDDLDATIAEIRTTIFSLQHQNIDDRGLRQAMSELIADSRRSLGFEPTVSFAGPIDADVPSRLHDDITATLREALSNMARHARATAGEVEASVDSASRTFLLRVIDNGVGISAQPRLGDGLRNLKARAAACGGVCEVQNADAGGTVVTWQIPLPIQPSTGKTS